ncbi:MAG TPA: hypothetical protein VGA08_03695 [Candidatus Saccharimonadales bacterium]
MDAFEILVVILSIALAGFLLLGIIFMVYLIRISRRVHEISEKARAAADSVEAAARIFQKTAGPAVFSRIVANVVEGWQAKKGKKEKK